MTDIPFSLLGLFTVPDTILLTGFTAPKELVLRVSYGFVYLDLDLAHYQLVFSFHLLVKCRYLHVLYRTQFLIFGLLHIFDVINT